MTSFPVVKDQCFIFNGDTPIKTYGMYSPKDESIVVKGDTFKCEKLFTSAKNFPDAKNYNGVSKNYNGFSKYPAVYGIRFSKSLQNFSIKRLYEFPESEFINIEPVGCPPAQEVLGGKRKNRKNSKLTKKFRRNRRRYSRRN